MKKIIISSLILITIISTFSNCFAFDIGEKNLISLGACEKLMTYNGVPIRTTYIVYEKDGVYYPAYCLDMELPGAENGSYIVRGGSKLQNVDVWKAIINGFPYKSVAELGAANEQEAFIATKQAVYTMLYGRDTNSYGAIDSDAGRRTYQIYLNIVNNARNSQESIQNDLSMSISTNQNEWTLDENNRCVSKTYTVNSVVKSGTYRIELGGVLPDGMRVTDENNNTKNSFNIGENFKILIPIQNLKQTEKFNIKAIANFATKPVAYGSTTVPGTQNYALTGYMYEVSECNYLDEYFKNITKLKIIKKEYGTEKCLSGVKFNLLDQNKDVVMENLVTDENGEITLENMLPGMYYICEIETLDGYNLYTDLIDVDLDLNEEFEVTVNNTTREITEIDKTFENVEVIPQYTETVYNVENRATILKENNIKKLPVTGY